MTLGVGEDEPLTLYQGGMYPLQSYRLSGANGNSGNGCDEPGLEELVLKKAGRVLGTAAARAGTLFLQRMVVLRCGRKTTLEEVLG